MLNKKLRALMIKCGIAVLLCLIALAGAMMGFSHQQTQAAAPSLLKVGIASPGPAQIGVIASTVSIATSNALDYWTQAKMKAAQPADILLNTKAIPPRSAETPLRRGTEQSIDPVLPGGMSSSHSSASEQSGQTGQSAQTSEQAQAVAHPYTFPAATVGKVFFTDPQTGNDYVCSGTAVASTNNDTIDTAGHCVANGGKGYFYTNWVFCGNYYNGCPDGYMWEAQRLFTHPDWYNNGWLTYDYGEAVVNPNDNGNVGDMLGGAGIAYNQPYQQQYRALGYPQESPYDGTELRACQSNVTQRDQPDSQGSPTEAINCDMTGGSSGGGWLISLKGNAYYVNGHSDYKYANDTQHLYSPYYGDDWYSVYNAAQNE